MQFSNRNGKLQRRIANGWLHLTQETAMIAICQLLQIF
jgi:hypothetical protein